MMLLMNIYGQSQRFYKSQKGDIRQRMEGVPTDYDVEFEPDIEDRLKDE